jgi:hypothetical protein
MKRVWLHFFLVGVFVSLPLLTGSLLSAQEKGPSPEVIKGLYRQILTRADKNGDGKLSLAECMSISKDKNKIEKDCKYWDADGDGVITEEEYVKQVRGIMR